MAACEKGPNWNSLSVIMQGFGRPCSKVLLANKWPRAKKVQIGTVSPSLCKDLAGLAQRSFWQTNGRVRKRSKLEQSLRHYARIWQALLKGPSGKQMAACEKGPNWNSLSVIMQGFG